MQSNFKDELLLLDEELSKPIDRDKLLYTCACNRLSKLLKVQAAYFDESLDTIQSHLNMLDFSDKRNITYNLKKFNALFKNLHHCMGIDRHRMIDYLIKLSEI